MKAEGCVDTGMKGGKQGLYMTDLRTRSEIRHLLELKGRPSSTFIASSFLRLAVQQPTVCCRLVAAFALPILAVISLVLALLEKAGRVMQRVTSSLP